MHAPMHARTHARTHACTHARMHARSHARARALARTHACSHTHTLLHTHAHNKCTQHKITQASILVRPAAQQYPVRWTMCVKVRYRTGMKEIVKRVGVTDTPACDILLRAKGPPSGPDPSHESPNQSTTTGGRHQLPANAGRQRPSQCARRWTMHNAVQIQEAAVYDFSGLAPPPRCSSKKRL
jgi:hypothetical protein